MLSIFDAHAKQIVMNFDDICTTLNLLSDWEEKYTYLIELGTKLPPYPAENQAPAYSVPGCMANVWMDYSWQNKRLDMRLMSDAVIVKGLLAILFSLYQNKTAAEILDIDAKAAFCTLGLENKMTANRRDGFVAVAARITALAKAAQSA